jgi:hypothetical protein
MKEIATNGTCSLHGEEKMYNKFESKILKLRDHLQNLGVNKSIILKWHESAE